MALLRSRNWQTAWLPRLDPFIDLLDDSSADVREMAREFLTRMTSQDFGGESAKWREWYAPIREKYRKGETRDMVIGGKRNPARNSADVRLPLESPCGSQANVPYYICDKTAASVRPARRKPPWPHFYFLSATS